MALVSRAAEYPMIMRFVGSGLNLSTARRLVAAVSGGSA